MPSGDVNAAAELSLAERKMLATLPASIALKYDALVAEVETQRDHVETLAQLHADVTRLAEQLRAERDALFTARNDALADLIEARAELDAARQEVNTERARFVRDLDALRVEKQQLEEQVNAFAAVDVERESARQKAEDREQKLQAWESDAAISAGVAAMRKMLIMRVGDQAAHAEEFRRAALAAAPQPEEQRSRE